MIKKTQKLYELIESSFPGLPLKLNIPWSEITTIGVGDTVPLLAEPSDDIALVHLLKFCHQNEIPVSVLGAGSNMLGTDAYLNGLLIRLAQNDFVRVKTSRNHVTAGAGVRLYDLIVTSAHKGFGGAPGLAAIPGTVGGAIKMNAGACDTTITGWMLEVCGFTMEGTYWGAQKEDLKIGYRYCSIPDNVIITAAIFMFDKVDSEEEIEKISEEISRRHQNHPRGKSAGCIFRNPSPGTPAGKLIDQCGCKNLRSGDLVVSNKHANYFLNQEQASEQNFIELSNTVKKRVFDKTGIFLRPEVCLSNKETAKSISSYPPPIKVAVLKGGNSSERDVSLESGAAVASALQQAGYDVTEIDLKQLKYPAELDSVDIVFPVLHGGFGENGDLQSLLEEHNKSFIGCDSKASRQAIDKIVSKNIMRENNIPTPDFAVIDQTNRSFPDNLSLPVVVKPPLEGSTFGITIVSDQSQWESALEDAFKYGNTVLVEQYIQGKEATVGILDGQPLPVVEIRYPGKMYDYDAKYTHANGDTEYLCPPEGIAPDIQKKAQTIAKQFYSAIQARDLLRVDFIISDDNKLYILEGNNIPGFTASSLLPKAAKVADLSFVELCAKLAKLAFSRKK